MITITPDHPDYENALAAHLHLQKRIEENLKMSLWDEDESASLTCEDCGAEFKSTTYDEVAVLCDPCWEKRRDRKWKELTDGE